MKLSECEEAGLCSDEIQEVRHAYLVWDQNVVSLCDRLSDIRNQGVAEITQTARLPIGLDPSKVRELHNKEVH